MKPIQVGLLGIGTVGSGTFEVLKRNQEEIQRRAGRPIQVTMVADLDTARAQAIVGKAVNVVNDARQVIANPDIDIVVELIGGYGIAKQLVLEAIAAGKHVVTANKALLGKWSTSLAGSFHPAPSPRPWAMSSKHAKVMSSMVFAPKSAQAWGPAQLLAPVLASKPICKAVKSLWPTHCVPLLMEAAMAL
jgi:hypothetical protein